MGLLWILTLNVGQLCFILGLTTKSRILRTSFFFPLSLILFSRVAFFDAYAQATPLDRLRSSAAGLNAILRAIELLLCSTDPHTEFKRDADKGINIGEQTFGRRFKWAVTLCGSQRGAGWNWRVPGTPPALPSSTPKTSFVLACLMRYAITILSLELISIIFAYLGSRATLEGPLVLLHGAIIYISIYATYEPGCIIWVLTGLSGVEECPPLFGKWEDARTLKGFWGRCWHQWFRRQITVIPNRFFKLLGLGPDTTCISAFFMSGAYHALTVHAMSIGTLYPKTFLFFALQPLGFLIEKHVLQIYTWVPTPARQTISKIHPPSDPVDGGLNNVVDQTTGDKPHYDSVPERQTITSYLGYLWVLTFLITTSRLYFSEMVETGFYEDARFGGEGWIPVKILRRFIE